MSKKLVWIISGLLLIAVFIFEVLNFSWTKYALTNIIGNLAIVGVPWAIVLSIALCFIDFVWVARIPDPYEPMPFYLWFSWVLAALLNTALTFWAVHVSGRLGPDWGSALTVASTVLLIRVLIMQAGMGKIGKMLVKP